MSIIKGRIVETPDGENHIVHSESFMSSSELISDLSTNPRRRPDKYDDMRDPFNIERSFCGVGSYQEALDLLHNGYTPLVDNLKKTIKTITKASSKPAFRNSVEGFVPIVPNVLRGFPNAMVDYNPKTKSNKIYDIYYDITCHAGTGVDQILAAGEKFMEALLRLELNGYKFNLYCCQAYTNEDNSLIDVFSLKVKSSDRPIDASRISFPLVHPGFFRVIGFDWQDRSPITRYVGHGRGGQVSKRIRNQQSRDRIFKSIFGYDAVYVCCIDFIENNSNTDDIIETLAQGMDGCLNPEDRNEYSKVLTLDEVLNNGVTIESHDRVDGNMEYVPYSEALGSLGYTPYEQYGFALRPEPDSDVRPVTLSFSHGSDLSPFSPEVVEYAIRQASRKYIEGSHVWIPPPVIHQDPNQLRKMRGDIPW